MCTIGCILDTEDGHWVFKQCDLAEPTGFLPPQVTAGEDGILYVAFLRDGASGPWAGFNNRGVGLVAADAYLEDDDDVNSEDVPMLDLTAVYGEVLAECGSLDEAVERMASFYAQHGPADAVLLVGPERAVLLESSPTHGVGAVTVHSGDTDGAQVVTRTNHFLTLPGGATGEENASTHVRLARAEELLDDSPDAAGIDRVLHDQAEGPTTLSICRVAEQPGEYATLASVAWVLRRDGRVDCAYVLNGNPRDKAWTTWTDVFGQTEPEEDAAGSLEDAFA